MNRYLTPLTMWLRSNNPIFRNFYHEIEEGRVASEDRYNNQRRSAENTINPHYYEELSIAALSLDGQGMPYYGPYTIALKDAYISHRSSVFEENPFYFAERHGVIAGHEPPPGYRATWADRASLGVAKLHSKLAEGMDDPDFASIIMTPNRDEADCDFIEVHIFAGLHREAIESVSGPKPADEVDAVFWEDAKARLASLGAKVEER